MLLLRFEGRGLGGRREKKEQASKDPRKGPPPLEKEKGVEGKESRGTRDYLQTIGGVRISAQSIRAEPEGSKEQCVCGRMGKFSGREGKGATCGGTSACKRKVMRCGA